MALNGLTQAKKLATFTAPSPLSSGTVPPNPILPSTSTMDPPPIARPEAFVRRPISTTAKTPG